MKWRKEKPQKLINNFVLTRKLVSKAHKSQKESGKISKF